MYKFTSIFKTLRFFFAYKAEPGRDLWPPKVKFEQNNPQTFCNVKLLDTNFAACLYHRTFSQGPSLRNAQIR